MNCRGGIADVVAFLSLDDVEAERKARDHFGRQDSYPSFELWEKARLVYRDVEANERQAARG